MVWDPSRQRIAAVDLGGNGWEIREWNGGDWVVRPTPPSNPVPNPLYDYRAAFDRARGRIVVLGGLDPATRGRRHFTSRGG